MGRFVIFDFLIVVEVGKLFDFLEIWFVEFACLVDRIILDLVSINSC